MQKIMEYYICKGMFRLVENSTRWKTSLSKKNTTAIAICARNFCLLVKPWLFFLTTMM